MEKEITCFGYNNEGRLIKTATARSARNEINPIEVQLAIENVKNVMSEQMNIIASKINSTSEDAGQAIIINSTTMGPIIESMADTLVENTDLVPEYLDEYYTMAVTSYNRLQKQYNDTAYREVKNFEGVERIVTSK